MKRKTVIAMYFGDTSMFYVDEGDIWATDAIVAKDITNFNATERWALLEVIMKSIASNEYLEVKEIYIK